MDGWRVIQGDDDGGGDDDADADAAADDDDDDDDDDDADAADDDDADARNGFHAYQKEDLHRPTHILRALVSELSTHNRHQPPGQQPQVMSNPVDVAKTRLMNQRSEEGKPL